MSHGFDNSRFDHEPLCLRVFFPQGPRTFELRDGLTIGSDVDCDVFIHHIDVEPHHAQISRSGGRWYVNGVFANHVFLLDGSAFRDLGLMRGTTFRVGPTVIQCVATSEVEQEARIPEAMPAAGASSRDERPGLTSATPSFGATSSSGAAASSGAVASVGDVTLTSDLTPGLHEAAVSLAAVPLHCVRCNGLIAHLPADAQFCPRCGQTLPPRPEASGVPGATPHSPRTRNALLDLLLPLLNATLPGSLRQRMSQLDPSRPATLLAYLNTLVRLGIRYEAGDGTSRNPSQALRYYTKAAKLGSEPAKIRLAAGGLAQTSSAEPAPTAERV